MKICYQCGNQLPDDTKLCTRCGCPIPEVPTQQAPVQSAVPEKKSGGTGLMIGLIAALVVVAVALGVVLGASGMFDEMFGNGSSTGAVLSGGEKDNMDDPSTVHTQDSQNVNVQDTTQQTEAVTEDPTEVARDFPDGTILIDGAWENGDLVIVALDDTTLWIRITDDRPDQQYSDYGTPWNIQLSFGAEMKIKNASGGYGVNYPFRIGLESLAAKEMMTYEYDQGNTPDYFAEEYLLNLSFWQSEIVNGGFSTVNKANIDLLDIDQNGDTYTAVITLPEWFDVSVYDDLTYAEANLYGTEFYTDLYGKGSANNDGYYRFDPINP